MKKIIIPVIAVSMLLCGRTATSEDYKGYQTYKLTAYCPCHDCSGNWGTQTSTGKTAKAGRTVAVDPNIIPYGSKVTINGHTYIAEDCGDAVKGYHIDIFFDTHEQVKQFGKQEEIAIIEE